MSSIDDYLDDLYARLPRDPRVARRTLDEAADHLHTAADALEAAGMDRAVAETQAVRRFGPATPLVRAATRRSLRTLVAEVARATTLLTGLGLVAVGVSGAVAALMNAWFGVSFVGGPGGSSTMQIVGVGPSHGSATITTFGRAVETAADAVSLRLLAGAAGVLLIGTAWAVSRRRPPRVLPRGLTTGLAAAAFGGATLVLAAASIDQWVQHGADGVGYYLSAAIVTGVGAVASGVPAARSMIIR